MPDKMWFNYNTEISMFDKEGYVAYVALIIILLRIAKKWKPSWWLNGDIHNMVASNKIKSKVWKKASCKPL